jgi:hypothetical protein
VALSYPTSFSDLLPFLDKLQLPVLGFGNKFNCISFFLQSFINVYCTRIYTYSCTSTHTCSCTHTYALSRTHALMHAHVHTLAHARTHARTHTCAYTLFHELIKQVSSSKVCRYPTYCSARCCSPQHALLCGTSSGTH